jgi:hypothetical protein
LINLYTVVLNWTLHKWNIASIGTKIHGQATCTVAKNPCRKWNLA